MRSSTAAVNFRTVQFTMFGARVIAEADRIDIAGQSASKITRLSDNEALCGQSWTAVAGRSGEVDRGAWNARKALGRVSLAVASPRLPRPRSGKPRPPERPVVS